ncbi:MAG: endolytic transglycosylase MltG [Clostridia bacterium]|nr:endolytic transglycosylase MltG [Clostridia bacterium]
MLFPSVKNIKNRLIESKTLGKLNFLLKNRIGRIKVLVLAFSLLFSVYILSPVTLKESVTLTISPKTTTSEIAELLKEKGVIRSATLFKIYAVLSNIDEKLKAGTYVFEGAQTVSKVAAELQKGSTKLITFTVPEGYTLEQIAQLLSDKGHIKKEDFFKAMEETKFKFPYIDELPAGEKSLEGFLFPDTYKIPEYYSAEDIIQMMLNRFVEVYSPQYEKRARELGISTLEIITLASIIEREAQKPEERPIIAAVFHNRLNKGMKLESCATVQYALGEVKPILTLEDLKVQSPYNTYINEGLPPGPICSPGEASIKAALYPADVPYYYFVAKKDRSHVFSRTYEEHLKAKEDNRSS